MLENGLAWESTSRLLVAWLSTYLLHSSILVISAWTLTRLASIRSSQLRETLWKVGLFGGLLTSSAQGISGYEPISGRVNLDSLTSSASQNQTPVESLHHLPLGARLEGRLALPWPGSALPFSLPGSDMPLHLEGRDWTDPRQLIERLLREPPILSMEAEAPGGPGRFGPQASRNHQASSWMSWAAGIWLALGASLCARTLWMRSALRRRLKDRVEVRDPSGVAALSKLVEKSGLRRSIRLTASARLSSPIVLGSSEICVPLRACTELDQRQFESLLAHELAHIVRRDSVWLLSACLIESVLFFQPLNRLARRRMQEETEFLCDAWAVRQTGLSIDLAKCLAEVATWIRGSRPAMAPSILGRSSSLVDRVERLCSDTPSPAPEHSRRSTLLATLFLISVAVAAPAVSATADSIDRSPHRKVKWRFVVIRDGEELRYIPRKSGPAQAQKKQYTL